MEYFLWQMQRYEEIISPIQELTQILAKNMFCCNSIYNKNILPPDFFFSLAFCANQNGLQH